MDLEEDEFQRVEEFDAEEGEPITWLSKYIPSRKGKTKVTKDPNSRKFTVSTPLLLEQVEFEGTILARIIVLKMEERDLVDHEGFPDLATRKYMTTIYYEETRVTWLEPMKWVRGVQQARFLHMLYVPHFHRSIIKTKYVCKLLTLVHDGCLWRG